LGDRLDLGCVCLKSIQANLKIDQEDGNVEIEESGFIRDSVCDLCEKRCDEDE
jgi:hypothetical protein